jgi:hypothetical protein
MQSLYKLMYRLGISKRYSAETGFLNSETWQPTHQHSKGGMYRVLARGVLEADETPMVIYDDVSGKIWIRPVVEFDDGRFVTLT